MDYKYNAIILSKIDVGETDRIYKAYTRENGKISLLGKGVKKPTARLAGNLEPLNLAEIFVAKSRGLGKITGVIGVENFSRMKDDVLSLENVFYAVRIFDRLVTQEEKDEKIFELLSAYLSELDRISGEDDESQKISLLTFGFVIKLLQNLGYALQVKKCSSCGKKLLAGKNYFSGPKGGVICPTCSGENSKKVPISDAVIKLIRIFLENKIENFTKIKSEKDDIRNLKLIVSEAVEWTVG